VLCLTFSSRVLGEAAADELPSAEPFAPLTVMVLDQTDPAGMGALTSTRSKEV
jgi:hypothetical protein